MQKYNCKTSATIRRLLMDGLPDLVCIKDGQGRWLEANRAHLALFGLTEVDYQGKTGSELAAHAPFFREVLSVCEETDQAAWESGKPIVSVERVMKPDGSESVFEVHKVPLFDETGERLALAVFGREVTQLVHAREALDQAHRQEKILGELLRLAFGDRPLSEVLDQALKILLTTDWLPVESKGAVLLCDQEGKPELVLVSHRNLPEQVVEKCGRVPFGACLCGKAAMNGTFLYVSDACADPMHRKDLLGIDDHADFVVPILGRDDLLGVLKLYAPPGEPCTDSTRAFLERVAQVLALLVEGVLGRGKLEERERALRRAQKVANLGYWRWDIVTGKLFWSEMVYQIFGLDPGRMVPTYDLFLEQVHPSDRELVREAVAKAMEGIPYRIRHRIVRPDGEHRVVLEEGEVVFGDDNTPREMFGIVQDVTLLAQTEEQLFLVEKVLETSREGVTITDTAGNILFVNQAFTEITGYAAEEVLGKNPRILKSDRHPPEFYARMWRQIEERGSWQGEIWNRRKSGEVYLEQLSITAIYDDHGRVSRYVAVFHDLSELELYRERSRFFALHDPLTKLPNRELFLDRLSVAVSHAERENKKTAVMLLDLDNFRHINETMGHTVGDAYLQQVAERLEMSVGEKGTVARLGGDDFAVLLEELDQGEEAALEATKIIEAISRPFTIGAFQGYVTASIGLILAPVEGRNPETLLKNAEIAMFRAKNSGKNRFAFFSEEDNRRLVRRLDIENGLRRALEREEFEVFYQPKVAVPDGRIIGAEALIRWRRGERLVSPAEFIPVAEESDLIISLGEVVLRRAAADLRRWTRLANRRLTVAVNVSPRQFLEPGFCVKLSEIIDEAVIQPDWLEIEVTEGLLFDDEQRAIEVMARVQEMGISLTLDDFGTGYSSLKYLKNLPISTLKIDRGFVAALPDSHENSAIVRMVLSLARELGIMVVAEGVETAEQLRFLIDTGCRLIQGYLFSPPVPPKAFEEMVNGDKRFDFGPTALPERP